LVYCYLFLRKFYFLYLFFWAFFHRRISPSIEIGQQWPPLSVITFDPINIPLLNTLILLSSGVSVTWSHHRIITSDYRGLIVSLGLTVLLGIYFTFLQGFEYKESFFSISDSVYGSSFFIATGFHGLHVIIGTSFLLVIFIRMYVFQACSWHLMGFEAAAWYWHFVDVVWLFLYVSLYWWGSLSW